LHNRGWRVRVAVVGRAESMSPDTRVNFQIARAMNLLDLDATIDHLSITRWVGGVTPDEVVIDALLGTGFQGQVREPLATAIETINSTRARAVVAVDVPSGLDVDTGLPAVHTIRADLTVTFVALKIGFQMPSAAPFLGEVVVADIGAPLGLADEVAAGLL
jgi:NAD(P)H-hydrate epimerase